MSQKPKSQFTITDLYRGEGDRSNHIYAVLRDEDGNLCISATLDYIVASLRRGDFWETRETKAP